jgi:hypothetical protein
MKQLVLTALTICGLFLPLNAQFSFGIQLGLPGNDKPEADHLLVYGPHPTDEFLFNIEQVKYGEQIGTWCRKDLEGFWFMGEVWFGKSTTHFSMIRTQTLAQERSMDIYKIKKHTLQVPLTAGVKFRWFEMYSGLDVFTSLKTKNDLTQLKGYSESASSWTMGWHAGVGINAGIILVQLRFQQQLCNYGTGLFIHDEELMLDNLPDRLMTSVALRF